jgi:predicted RecB family nuclease
MKKRKTSMLSKTRFLAGLQCPLRLWYQCYRRDLATEISPAQQAIFDSGHEVGRLATRLYPHGIFIKEDYLHHGQAVKSTLAAMAKPDVKAIYEAAFIHQNVRIRVDILQKHENGNWNLIEVKSSTAVKDVHLSDVAVQHHVLKGLGLSIEKAGILHLNNQYVYDGQRMDLDSLFNFVDLTDQLFAPTQRVPAQLGDFKQMLAASAPVIPPDRHCKNPYPCEFWEHCTRKMPEFWVFGLSGIGQDRLLELAGMGIVDIRDIPGSFPLTQIQHRIRSCVVNQEEYIAAELESQLKDVEYPIHFLDFETVSPAIPRYSGTRPYQAIAFQWSDHILFADGNIAHREYLCDEDKNPAEEFTRRLVEALGTTGTIFIYTAYEKGIIKELAEYLPRYNQQLNAITGRFKDLYAIIKRDFYQPKFLGSFSLKSVLPALVPDMNYESLSIQEGSQASLEYLKMVGPDTLVEEKERIKNDLLAYCGQDTLALVKIREALLKRFDNG